MGNVTSYVKYGASSPHLQLIASQDREKIKRNNVNLSGIVCTIGPASTNEDILVEMMRAGMRIARLNFSHGSHAEHADRIKTIRRAMKLYQDRYNHPCPLGIALDTKGPEIRTGIIEQGETSKVELKEGSFVKITPKPEYKKKCNDKIIYIDYQILLQKIKVGQEIYIDDGKIILKSVAVEHDFVECKVVNGGLLGSKKGVALPGVQIDLPVISDQDKEDLKFAIDHDIDIIFASFVKNTQDIKQIRDALGDRGRNILIVAKIESEEVLKKGEMLMDRSAGVMVGRGDLALRIPFEQVFQVQKQIIALCNVNGKPAICATQMLESMMDKRRPSRADVSDIGNAIFDGADCVMLSAETAVGKYPVECVKAMAKICIEAETFNWNGRLFHEILTLTFNNNEADGFCMSAVAMATYYEVEAIIVTAEVSKDFVKLVSKFKPRCPIIAVTRDVKFSRQIGLYRGAFGVVYEEATTGQTATATAAATATATVEDSAIKAAKKENDTTKKELKCAVDYGLKRGILQQEDSVVILRRGQLKARDDPNNVVVEMMRVDSIQA